MSKLRIYKEFYRIDYIDGVNDNYTLIDPFSLTAATYNFSTSQIVESLTTTQESLGNYYIELNGSLYTFPTVYQIIWYVEYLNNGIVKQLRTKFLFDPVKNYIISELDIEFSKYVNINYEISNSVPLDYEIKIN
jgi:hypothetical protein